MTFFGDLCQVPSPYVNEIRDPMNLLQNLASYYAVWILLLDQANLHMRE